VLICHLMVYLLDNVQNNGILSSLLCDPRRSGMLGPVGCYLVTGVLGQLIGSIFKGLGTDMSSRNVGN
jgi:hypothetical protein